MGAQHRRYRRSLQIETLDGSVPDPLVVDYLDQYQVLKNALDKAERGTEQWLALTDETAIVSDYLSQLLQGYAIIVSVQPSSTAIGGATLTVAEATTTPGTGAPTTTSVDAPPTATPTSGGPVIVTVVPQENTSIVVVASEGTTRTVTRGSQTRTAASPTATEQPAGEAEEQLPRSITTSKGAVQTAVGASAGDETRPSSDARIVTVLSSTWWIVPAGLAGLLASIV